MVCAASPHLTPLRLTSSPPNPLHHGFLAGRSHGHLDPPLHYAVGPHAHAAVGSSDHRAHLPPFTPTHSSPLLTAHRSLRSTPHFHRSLLSPVSRRCRVASTSDPLAPSPLHFSHRSPIHHAADRLHPGPLSPPSDSPCRPVVCKTLIQPRS